MCLDEVCRWLAEVCSLPLPCICLYPSNHKWVLHFMCCLSAGESSACDAGSSDMFDDVYANASWSMVDDSVGEDEV